MGAGKFHGKRAEEILENVVRLAELLDDDDLKEMADVPFLELAKAVSINRRNSPSVMRKKESGKVATKQWP
jgi:hypothetical protein